MLKKQLEDANSRIGRLASINEMLKLSLTDALTQLSFFHQNVNGLVSSLITNLTTLKGKLPDMSKYNRKTVSQIQRELKDEQGPSTIIDISKKDDEDQ